MSRPERTALLFLSAVLLTGALVRGGRALSRGARPQAVAEAALARQRAALDSSAEARKAAPGRERRQALPQPPVPVDVDRATAAELESLPRIGSVLAARIVAEREARGAFGSLDSLEARVRGIGPALAELLRTRVTFAGR